jgi:beta-glucosidase/6-phospho-beta-glucosidase/beta-galactosidase
MAGFECSCQINSAGMRLDMTSALQHDVNAAADYHRLREAGIATARDGIRWHLVEQAGSFQWGSWLPMLRAARAANVQVIWDLCHYGWPDDLDIFSPEFVDRYARFAGEAAHIHRGETGEAGFWAPVNEISFFAWAASRELIFPYAWGRGGDLKRQVVNAAIAGIDAIRAVSPQARIVFAEPLIHNVPPRWRPWNTGPARGQRASQFEALDMIAAAGPGYLDIVGVNFYAANQWEVPGGRKLHWDNGSNDPRWVPLHKLLAEVHERYRRPMFIAETSHYGTGRGDWILEVARECRAAIDRGVPIEGVCLYPILDRFDWEDCTHWHNSGLWDMHRDAKGHYQRVLNREYASGLEEAQALVGGAARRNGGNS